MFRREINRIMIIGFMILVGYSLANGIIKGSYIAIVLSTLSLCAGAYFVYLLEKMKREMSESNNG